MFNEFTGTQNEEIMMMINWGEQKIGYKTEVGS